PQRLGTVDVRLVRLVELAERGAAPVKQRFPAGCIAPPRQLRRIGAFLLVVVKRVGNPARIKPSARLLHGVAVGNPVELDGHACSLRLNWWMRGLSQANNV